MSAPFYSPPTADECNECALLVAEDDAAPSCGAHVLHIHCTAWFGCRECHRVQKEDVL